MFNFNQSYKQELPWFTNLFQADSKYLKQLKVIEYILGFDLRPEGRLILESGNPALRLVNPFKAYQEEVNRFLFGGGLTVDLNNAKEKDPRQVWLNQQLTKLNLNQLANLCWERGSATGEIALVFTQAKDENGLATMYYNVDMFDYPEFTPLRDENGELIAISVLAYRLVEGKEMVFKAVYDKQNYTIWPLIEAGKETNKNWLNSYVQYPHNYQKIPGVVIRNKLSDPKARGLSDFDKAACELATEIILQEINSAENHYFFAHPFFSGDDPEGIEEAIRLRKQVLQSGATEDGGHPKVLQPLAMPESHDRLLERLQKNFKEMMGISTQVNQATNDLASVTLKLLNAATISTAEKRWASYVQEGFEPFLETLLLAAGVDGILAGVWFNRPETYDVSVSRQRPYFSLSPSEKQTMLGVVESLVTLGVKREVALQREYFPEMTLEQVLDMLEGDY